MLITKKLFTKSHRDDEAGTSHARLTRVPKLYLKFDKYFFAFMLLHKNYNSFFFFYKKSRFEWGCILLYI